MIQTTKLSSNPSSPSAITDLLLLISNLPGFSKYDKSVLLKGCFYFMLLLCSASLQAQPSQKLFAWGKHTHGQLGNGTSGVVNVGKQLDEANDWVSVSAGVHHSLAIKADGSLWTWGVNITGQLDNSGTEQYTVPIRVGTGTNWKSISAGSFHNLAIKADGTLWAGGKILEAS